MSIQWDKPIEAMGGTKAELVHTSNRRRFGCRLVVIATQDGALAGWYSEGGIDHDHANRYPLRNVPETVSRWMNVYPDRGGDYSDSRECADRVAMHNKNRLYVIREDTRGDQIEITIEDV